MTRHWSSPDAQPIGKRPRNGFARALRGALSNALYGTMFGAATLLGVAGAALMPGSALAEGSVALLSGRLNWGQLSAAQQTALKPLAGQWATLNEGQQRMWLALAANYHDLSAAEQAKLQSRMAEWAALSPQQRTQVRQGYDAARQVPADERKAKWEAYKSLPTEQREHFGADRRPLPRPGAAPALHTQPPPVQLVPPPVGSADSRAKPGPTVRQPTLLPQTTPVPAPARGTRNADGG